MEGRNVVDRFALTINVIKDPGLVPGFFFLSFKERVSCPKFELRLRKPKDKGL